MTVAARIVTFDVPGTPVPKARTRQNRYGARYLPARTAEYQTRVALFARRAAGQGRFGRGVAVAVELVFVERRWRGDLDNLAKAALDGLQAGGLIEDDRQVTVLRLERVRAADGAAEATCVTVAASRRGSDG